MPHPLVVELIPPPAPIPTLSGGEISRQESCTVCRRKEGDASNLSSLLSSYASAASTPAVSKIPSPTSEKRQAAPGAQPAWDPVSSARRTECTRVQQLPCKARECQQGDIAMSSRPERPPRRKASGEADGLLLFEQPVPAKVLPRGGLLHLPLSWFLPRAFVLHSLEIQRHKKNENPGATCDDLSSSAEPCRQPRQTAAAISGRASRLSRSAPAVPRPRGDTAAFPKGFPLWLGGLAGHSDQPGPCGSCDRLKETRHPSFASSADLSGCSEPNANCGDLVNTDSTNNHNRERCQTSAKTDVASLRELKESAARRPVQAGDDELRSDGGPPRKMSSPRPSPEKCKAALPSENAAKPMSLYPATVRLKNRTPAELDRHAQHRVASQKTVPSSVPPLLSTTPGMGLRGTFATPGVTDRAEKQGSQEWERWRKSGEVEPLMVIPMAILVGEVMKDCRRIKSKKRLTSSSTPCGVAEGDYDKAEREKEFSKQTETAGDENSAKGGKTKEEAWSRDEEADHSFAKGSYRHGRGMHTRRLHNVSWKKVTSRGREMQRAKSVDRLSVQREENTVHRKKSASADPPPPAPRRTRYVVSRREGHETPSEDSAVEGALTRKEQAKANGESNRRQAGGHVGPTANLLITKTEDAGREPARRKEEEIPNIALDWLRGQRDSWRVSSAKDADWRRVSADVGTSCPLLHVFLSVSLLRTALGGGSLGHLHTRQISRLSRQLPASRSGGQTSSTHSRSTFILSVGRALPLLGNSDVIPLQ